MKLHLLMSSELTHDKALKLEAARWQLQWQQGCRW
jgi:hypothetical protein